MSIVFLFSALRQTQIPQESSSSILLSGITEEVGRFLHSKKTKAKIELGYMSLSDLKMIGITNRRCWERTRVQGFGNLDLSLPYSWHTRVTKDNRTRYLTKIKIAMSAKCKVSVHLEGATSCQTIGEDYSIMDDIVSGGL